MRGLAVLTLLAISALAADEELETRAAEQCARLSSEIEAFLGPKFEAVVPVRMVDIEFIADFARDLNRRIGAGGLTEIAQRLAERLHQVPKGYDLEGEQIALVRKTVAGLYDPEKDCFYVVKSTGAPGTPTFTLTAAHELVHAYRDVDKDYWQRTLASVHVNMDRAVAMTCLVEGDATLLGLALAFASLQKTEPGPLLEHQVESALSMSPSASLPIPGLERFPIALRETFVRRYVMGMIFAAHVYRDGGLKALEEAYGAPPISTEQVLHPEKFLGPERDEPTAIRGGDPTAALGEGWTLTLSNVPGEFELQVHFIPELGRERAERAAAGWDGARFFFCEKEGSAGFLGLVSTWDSEEDAREFAEAWIDWAALRDVEEKIDPAERVRRGEGRYSTTTAEGPVIVLLEGKEVIVADGVPEGRSEAVLRALAAATRDSGG